MRLWTIHPRYLDAKGLVALWREGLLAQKVIQRKTKGYRHHPQLTRFQLQVRPLAAIATYLSFIFIEAQNRGYRFDSTKIAKERIHRRILETEGQLLYEWLHFKRKLRKRNYHKYLQIRAIKKPNPHPLFRIVPGKVQEWEQVK
jgi:hypothetical protein